MTRTKQCKKPADSVTLLQRRIKKIRQKMGKVQNLYNMSNIQEATKNFRSLTGQVRNFRKYCDSRRYLYDSYLVAEADGLEQTVHVFIDSHAHLLPDQPEVSIDMSGADSQISDVESTGPTAAVVAKRGKRKQIKKEVNTANNGSTAAQNIIVRTNADPKTQTKTEMDTQRSMASHQTSAVLKMSSIHEISSIPEDTYFTVFEDEQPGTAAHTSKPNPFSTSELSSDDEIIFHARQAVHQPRGPTNAPQSYSVDEAAYQITYNQYEAAMERKDFLLWCDPRNYFNEDLLP